MFIYLFIYLIIYLITYLSYCCTGGTYPNIYYVLFVTFIIYIIIIIIVTITIIITIIIIIVIVINAFMLSLFIPPQSFFKFLLTYYCYFNGLWFLFFQLICNYMGIVFFKLNVSFILKHCFLFIY